MGMSVNASNMFLQLKAFARYLASILELLLNHETQVGWTNSRQQNILADDHRYRHGVRKRSSETTILREKEILGLADDTLNLHVGHRVLLLWILTLDCRVSMLTVTSNDP